MKLFSQIVDLSRDLIAKYSLKSVNIDDTTMYMVSDKSLLVDIMVWRDETYVSLICKSNKGWLRYYVGRYFLSSFELQQILQNKLQVSTQNATIHEKNLSNITFFIDVLRLKGDEIFLDKTMSWTNKYSQAPTKVSLEEIKKIESIVESCDCPRMSLSTD